MKLRRVGPLALLTLALASVGPTLACTGSLNSQGYTVDAFSYTFNSSSGTVAAAASGIRYQAANQRDSVCGSMGLVGSSAQYQTRAAHLELWVFSNPFQSGMSGYQLLVSPTVQLSMTANQVSMPMPPANYVPYGGSYATGNVTALAQVPPGAWWPTAFLFDDQTGQAFTWANATQPTNVVGSQPPPPSSSVSPQVGLWWNPNESGSGYALDFKHGVLVVTIYSYKSTGEPQWYLAAGPLNGNVFTATLDKYALGQCISCAYRSAAPIGNDGAITITFTSATSGTVQLPGGRVTTIQPQAF
jgi:hypothetical protein